MTATPSEIRARVVFRKQASDGNYGSETAEVAIDVPLEEVYDLSEESIAATLATARRLVHEELRKSPSPSVRLALESLNRGKPAAANEVDELEDLPFEVEAR
jgi:hypothetical protein